MHDNISIPVRGGASIRWLLFTFDSRPVGHRVFKACSNNFCSCQHKHGNFQAKGSVLAIVTGDQKWLLPWLCKDVYFFLAHCSLQNNYFTVIKWNLLRDAQEYYMAALLNICAG